MDCILDILLKKSEMNKLNLSEVLVTWGGERFHQDPPKFISDSGLLFTESTDKEYYRKLIGNYKDIDDLLVLHFDDALLDLEFAVNREGDVWNNKIMIFLSQMLELETFIILLIRDEEEIDEFYKIRSKDELESLLCNSLSWETPKGILITNR